MNPFEPPSSKVADQPRKPGSPAKAILLGLLVDIGGTMLFGLIFGVIYAVYLASQGIPEAQMPEMLSSANRNGWVFALTTSVGCGFSVLGGFVCARVSRRTDYKLAAVLAGCSVAVGLLFGSDSETGFQLFLLSAVTVACVLLGNKYGMVQSEA